MSKAIIDFKVVENNKLTDKYSLLVLTPVSTDTAFNFHDIKPGQFVEVRIDTSKTTFLRRPISVNYVDPIRKHLHLLVRGAGEGTHALCAQAVGDIVNIMLPLGNGFSIVKATKPLLVGGGVGVAPLLYLGKQLRDNGIAPSFLLAARSKADLLELDKFKELGDVYISTDDGSAGHPGIVTLNPALEQQWDMIYCCGPMPMMKAIAKIANSSNINCEVSLENSMACGLGACLCCVEDTIDGNVCVCKEGPVFNIKQLKW